MLGCIQLRDCFREVYDRLGAAQRQWHARRGAVGERESVRVVRDFLLAFRVESRPLVGLPVCLSPDRGSDGIFIAFNLA